MLKVQNKRYAFPRYVVKIITIISLAEYTFTVVCLVTNGIRSGNDGGRITNQRSWKASIRSDEKGKKDRNARKGAEALLGGYIIIDKAT